MSLVTTAPAPITTLLPILQPGITITLLPKYTSFPIVIGLVISKSGTSFLKINVPPSWVINLAPFVMCTLSPMVISHGSVLHSTLPYIFTPPQNVNANHFCIFYGMLFPIQLVFYKSSNAFNFHISFSYLNSTM